MRKNKHRTKSPSIKTRNNQFNQINQHPFRIGGEKNVLSSLKLPHHRCLIEFTFCIEILLQIQHVALILIYLSDTPHKVLRVKFLTPFVCEHISD